MLSSPFSLKSKLALITGGGSGIGFGIATAFINAGARVILTGRRERVLADAVALLGENARYIQHDITDLKTIPAMISSIEDQDGPIDVLVNNAGMHLKKWAHATTDDEFYQVVNTNLLSVFSICRACAGHMVKRGKGSILLISSMTAFFGMDQVSAYSASKASLTGLLHAFVAEYSKDGIRVNAIAPGWIESDIFRKAIESDDQRKQKIMNRISMKEFGKPEDIGYAAVYLSSDAGRYVTGVILPVDGGARVSL